MAAYVRRGNLLVFTIFLFGFFTFVQSKGNVPELPKEDTQFGAIVHDPNQRARLEKRNNDPQVVQQSIRDAVQVPQENDIQQKTGGQPQVRIWNSTECRQDVQHLCSPKIQKNNFAILDCLQNADEESVNEVCQHFLYQYKRNLTLDMRFDSASKQVCSQELEMYQDCKSQPDGQGMKIPCLVEHLDELKISPNCRQYLTRMAAIVFSDYKLIYKFVDMCIEDILKNGCGRLEVNVKHPHSQGATLECLAKHLATLSPQCKRQLLRVAELQSDDYHMDRPLYYACREDLDRFCENISAGGGKVFECLFKHKFEQEMSKNDLVVLEEVVLLIAQRYRQDVLAAEEDNR